MLASIGTDSLRTLISETVPCHDPPATPARPSRRRAGTRRTGGAEGSCGEERGQEIADRPGLLRHADAAGDPAQPVRESRLVHTAYTPYQAEIAQGRLEALLNYQQMVIDLTGLEIANASLLDEATAAAEAMTMARRASKAKGNVFFVDDAAFPQTIDVLKTRAAYFGFELVFGRPEDAHKQELFGALFQYPNARGEIADLTTAIAEVKNKGGVVAVASDLMALVLLKSPGEMGADIALGSAQRFWRADGFRRPSRGLLRHARGPRALDAGRIIGVSKDARGKTAYRMALQTREQHIRREKANSNICTSQVLLANIAGMYAVWARPQGATRHRLAHPPPRRAAGRRPGRERARILRQLRSESSTGRKAQRWWHREGHAGRSRRRLQPAPRR
jgi:glycine dehydrogenase